MTLALFTNNANPSKQGGKRLRIEVLADVKTHSRRRGRSGNPEQERLYWIDSFDGRVFRATAQGSEIRCWDVPQKIGSMALRKGRRRRPVVSLQRGFHLLDFKNRRGSVDRRPLNPARPTTGSTTARSTSMAGLSRARWTRWRKGPNGALYRLDPELLAAPARQRDHRLQRPVLEARTARTFYFADTWTGEIWRYDYDQSTGAATNRRTFVKVDTSRGGAGRRLDGRCGGGACGTRWSTTDGWCATIPTGRVDRVIEMPVKKITQR